MTLTRTSTLAVLLIALAVAVIVFATGDAEFALDAAGRRPG
jgi:hypothetical protein